MLGHENNTLVYTHTVYRGIIITLHFVYVIANIRTNIQLLVNNL